MKKFFGFLQNTIHSFLNTLAFSSLAKKRAAEYLFPC
jgi:hypothetical protein